MDHRKAAKRPRSSTPAKGAPGALSSDSSPPKKKSKSNRKTKKNRNKAATEATAGASSITSKPKSSLDETATAEGQMMAQMLSTFSSSELSRFEAYQRASLSASAVQDWVAACLVHRLGDSTTTTTTTTDQHQHNNNKRRPLSDLVVPGSHEDIGVVVATAAKIYAQRLVAAAVRLQSSQQQHQQQQLPLTPHHVWQAWQERQAAGLDPGFYLQANPKRQLGSQDAAAVYERKRLAAREAQDAYDAEFGTVPSEEEAAVDAAVGKEGRNKCKWMKKGTNNNREGTAAT